MYDLLLGGTLEHGVHETAEHNQQLLLVDVTQPQSRPVCMYVCMYVTHVTILYDCMYVWKVVNIPTYIHKQLHTYM